MMRKRTRLCVSCPLNVCSLIVQCNKVKVKFGRNITCKVYAPSYQIYFEMSIKFLQIFHNNL
jgi:hypothetical protein